MNILPCKETAEPHWKTLVEELYKLYCEGELVYTDAGGGKWIRPDEAWYLDGCMMQSKRQLLHQLLCDLNEPVVEVPQHVIEGINENVITSLVSPAMVRNAMRGRSLSSKTRENKLTILEYILSDRQFQDLDQIELLPLSNGAFASFTTTGYGDTIYIASNEHPQNLLPGMDHLFLANTSYQLEQNLKELAFSGCTQLRHFEAEAFILQLPNVSNRNRVPAWFDRIWEYIGNHFPYSLARFEGQAILPITLVSGATEHMRIEAGRPWLLIGDDYSVRNVLKSLGTRLFRSINCVPALHHPQLLGNYIKKNDISGVLECINNVSYQSNHRQVSADFLRETNAAEKLAFQKCCYRIHVGVGLSRDAISILAELAMFTLQGTERRQEFTSCVDTQVGCREKLIFPHKERVVDLSEDQSRILAESLGVYVIDATGLIGNYILPSISAGVYTESETFTIMKYIFNNHLTGYSSICDQLKTLEFVVTKGGVKRTPHSLFDPNDGGIKPFLTNDNIPGKDYMNYINELKVLGLKTADTVEARDVLRFVHAIGYNKDASRILVKLFSRRPSLLTEDVDWKQLGNVIKTVKWIPVKEKAPDNYPEGLRWYGKNTSLASPEEVMEESSQFLVGSQVPIVECSSDPLACYYHWDREPDVNIIIAQLKQTYALCQRGTVREHTISHMTEKIYDHIQRLIHKPAVLQSCNEIGNMIWIGKDFVNAAKIVPVPPLQHMEPFIYKLPGQLERFKTLLTRCGMKETCNLIDILHEIKQYHSPLKDAIEERVDGHINLIISILELLSKQGLKQEHLDLIPIPTWTSNNTVKMCLIKDCVYDDRVWRPGFSADSAEISFVHPKIPPILAEALKIKTLASKVLDVTELAFGGFQDHGQSVKLTDVLKDILKEYPDGFSVPKELIQNADDAGATEISFVFDERKHEDFRSKLFDSNMSKCQGPALFAYNNAKFLEADFENIIKLRGKTKEEQLDKIGKFGVGFNAVYHLTDVPSFISGENMVLFDPNLSHLKNCIRDTGKPGIKVNIGRRKAVEQFSDQYQPYEGIHDCAVLKTTEDGYTYPGTLFRFPLRTVEQAEESKICNMPYDQSEVKKLLKLFIEHIDTCLLFTQNVRKITIYRIPTDARTVRDKIHLCQVEKNMETEIRTASKCINSTGLENILKVASDLSMNMRKEVATSSVITNMEKHVSEDAMRFLQLGTENETSQLKQWLVCQLTDSRIAKKMPGGLKNQAPVGGIAVQLMHNGSHYLPKAIEDGKFFCFLPLPQASELPVHINGCFALSSSRRDLDDVTLCSTDKYSDGGEWNDLLLKEIISEAYVHALDIVTELGGKTAFEIWPNCNRGGSTQKTTLANAVLTRIARDKSVCLFSDGQTKYPLSGTAFLKNFDFIFEEDGQEENGEQQAKEILRAALRNQNTKLVDIPPSIYASFQQAGLEPEVSERMYTKERFLEEVFLPNIESFDRTVRDSILKMSILCNNRKVDLLLGNVKCIPVSPDGMTLKAPNEILYPRGAIAEMYTNEDGRFPFPGSKVSSQGCISFCTSEILMRLEQIGMPRDKLRINDIYERATSVAQSDTGIGIQRSMKIVQILPQVLKPEDDLSLSRLKEIAFLPVQAKPTSYPIPWHATKAKFCNANEAFPYDQRHTIGCVAPVVQEDTFEGRNDVQVLLGLNNKTPSPELLSKQIEIILQQTQLSITDREEKTEFEKCFYSVFKVLETMVRKEHLYNLSSLIENLKDRPCILLENSFVVPRSCAINFYGNCEPWLNKIPRGIRYDCQALLKELGVKEEFTLQDFIEILDLKHEQFGTKSLPNEEITAAVNVVDMLINKVQEVGTDILKLKKTKSIYIPDRNSVLRSCSDLCLFDEQFAENDSKFVHQSLSIKAGTMLCRLGVMTSKQRTVKKRCLGIPFGQSEKLQSRIRTILKGYPDDTTILKELLQNADDAGATELHFIFDPRTHCSESIFHESWKPMQGPALCVYNNKPFTEADLEGIKNLGLGSKADDATTTGQYGVGFNCVYHMTDTPTLMTQINGKDTLIAFDPTLHYVPDATPEEPGQMYNDIDHLKKKFPDVFEPFTFEGFSLTNSTMFRLPLRTYSEKPEAHVLDEDITVEKVFALLKSFEKDAGECLLFLKTVKKVSFSRVDQITGRIVNEYWVECDASSANINKKENFLRATKEVAQELKEGRIDLSKTGHYEVSYITSIRDSRGTQQKWVVVQSFGFKNLENLQKVSSYIHSQGIMGLLPYGGVAGLVTLGRGNIDEHESCSGNTKRHKIFCFLPLPLKSNMPVHLNGHFFLDHDSRRHLWGGTEEDFRSLWNNLIMTDILANSYISLMIFLRREILQMHGSGAAEIEDDKHRTSIERKIREYNQFFPIDDNTPYVQKLVDGFYKRIYSESMGMLPVIWKPERTEKDVIEFFSLTKHLGKQAVFKTTSLGKTLEETLHNCGYRFFHAPSHIKRKLKDLGLDFTESTPDHVCQFLCSDAEDPCHLREVPQRLSESPLQCVENAILLFKYCCQVEDFSEKLQGLPLLITKNEMLRKFDVREPVFCTIFSDLFLNLPQKFMHPNMVREFLSRDDISEVKQIERLDIRAFGEILPQILDENVYRSSKTYVEWNPVEKICHEKNKISRPWLKEVWRFFNYIHQLTKNNQGTDHADQLKQGERFSQLMKDVEEWHLIPVESESSIYLVPLKWPYLATNISTDGPLKPACDALRKLKLPTLSRRFFPRVFLSDGLEIEQILKDLSANELKPRELIFAINIWIENRPIRVKFSEIECNRLLSYFTSCVEFVEKSPCGRSTIRKMELFKDRKKQRVALDDKQCFTIARDIPAFNIEDLTQERTLFLSVSKGHEALFKVLEVKHLSHVDVYCTFIFKYFEPLKVAERFAHIKYVWKVFTQLENKVKQYQNTPNKKRNNRMRGESENDRRQIERLLSALQSLHFIHKESCLFKASHFHDPTSMVYQLMLPESFPPDPYRGLLLSDYDFLVFFRKIGLVSTVVPDQLRSFARIVEQMITQDPNNMDHCDWKKSIEAKSMAILDNLLNEQKKDSSLFKDMSRIVFVPLTLVISDLTALHRQNSAGVNSLNFVSLAQGMICGCNDPKLVWASTKLLDISVTQLAFQECTEDERPERKKWILEVMQISETPTLDNVISNVRLVCTAYMKTYHQSRAGIQNTIRDVLTSSYEFLNRLKKDTAVNQLNVVTCIGVEGFELLVRPAQVAIDMRDSDQIQPYFYKLPLELGTFKDLFLQLGVSLEPTMQQYQAVLLEIYTQSSQKTLTANELKCSYKAALGLMILLSHMKGKNACEGDLYLPSQSRVLVKSSELYYIDNPSYMGRVGGLGTQLIFEFGALDQVAKETNHEAEAQYMMNQEGSVYTIFPEYWRPKKLSEELVEKLEDESVQALDLEQCRVAYNLQTRFRTPQFYQGIHRLVKASGKKTKDKELDVLERLSKIQVIVLPVVKTVLMRRDGSFTSDSAKEQKCFLATNSDKIVLYLPRHVNERVYSMLAKTLARILDVSDALQLPLNDILSCDLQDIDQVLNDHEVAVNQAAKKFYGLPTLGTFIPIEEHHLLCEGFQLFNEGEYVGYMVEDTEEDTGSPIYIYAKVVKIDNSSGKILRHRCTIDIGDGDFKEVSVLDLYKFQRVKSTMGQLVPYIGEEATVEEAKEQSLEEILKEITEILDEAFKMEESEKRKVIKRLMLKWHPDKNIDNQEICTKIMQYIQVELRRLKSPQKGKGDGDFDKYYEEMGARARQYRSYRKSYHEEYSRSRSGARYDDSGIPPSFAKKNPQPRVAKQWMRQAKWDLRAAPRDKSNNPLLSQFDSYPEWICFKCHQAAEKALRGAQYAVDANMVNRDHNLIGAASSLDDSSILSPTRELDRLLGHSARMRYPNRCGDSIPHDVYTDHMAERALELASKIVELCKNYILCRTGNR